MICSELTVKAPASQRANALAFRVPSVPVFRSSASVFGLLHTRPLPSCHFNSRLNLERSAPAFGLWSFVLGRPSLSLVFGLWSFVSVFRSFVFRPLKEGN